MASCYPSGGLLNDCAPTWKKFNDRFKKTVADHGHNVRYNAAESSTVEVRASAPNASQKSHTDTKRGRRRRATVVDSDDDEEDTAGEHIKATNRMHHKRIKLEQNRAIFEECRD